MTTGDTRNTIQREIIYNAVIEMKCHPTPDEVWRFIQKSYPTIGKSTVYRNLNMLCDNGKLLRVNIPGGASHVDFTVQSHSHLICDMCGGVFDVDIPYKEHPASNTVTLHGFRVKNLSAVFTGLCPECYKTDQIKQS